MLTIENLTSAYGSVDAIHGMSLDVKEGEIVALLGPNGAGKSTLLRTISGLVPVRKGKMVFQGKDITRAAAHTIVQMGIIHVPEGRRIFGPLTVYENLMMGAHAIRRRLGHDGIAKAFQDVYDLFPRLKERKNQEGGTLSGGEQQMLAIGRGMMGKPKSLLLDEPTLGLAPIVAQEIVQAVLKLKERGVSVLLVEENASVALGLADRVYLVDLGKIVLESTPSKLKDDDIIQMVYLGKHA